MSKSLQKTPIYNPHLQEFGAWVNLQKKVIYSYEFYAPPWCKGQLRGQFMKKIHDGNSMENWCNISELCPLY